MAICVPTRSVAVSFCVALALLLLAVPSASRAASQPDQFCKGDPCVIKKNKSVDDGAFLDFGDRDVVLDAVLDVGSGSMTLSAGSLTMVGSSQLKGVGGKSKPGGHIRIQTSGDIALDSDRNGGAVRLNGADGGILTVRPHEVDKVGIEQTHSFFERHLQIPALGLLDRNNLDVLVEREVSRVPAEIDQEPI